MEVVHTTPHIPAVAVATAVVVPPASAIQENVNALLTAPWGFGINNQAVPFPPMLDRFMLHLPLLGGHAALTCTPEVPPDFIFPPGEEASFRLSTLKSLANWRPTESRTCLLECVVELFTLYKERQRALVKTVPDERLQFEISTIEEIPKVEFLAKGDEVCCLIPVAVTQEVQRKAVASSLTPVEAVYILVVFKPGHSTAPKVKLLLPPDWERCLGEVPLPAWSGEMCLIMFMPMVMEMIEEQLTQWYNRRTLLVELAEALGNPLEFDTNKNRSIHFLHSGEVVFTITITLSDAFPGEQPEILISSVEHHKANSQSLQIVYANYPYSPRWPAKEIAARIKKFLAEKLVEIKRRFEEDYKKANTNIGTSPASPIDLAYEHYQ